MVVRKGLYKKQKRQDWDHKAYQSRGDNTMICRDPNLVFIKSLYSLSKLQIVNSHVIWGGGAPLRGSVFEADLFAGQIQWSFVLF